MALTPRQQEALDRVHEVFREFTEALGPRRDGRTDYDPEDEPKGEVLLSEWCVLTYWVDADGKDYIVPWAPDGMARHHVMGLLVEALKDQGYEPL